MPSLLVPSPQRFNWMAGSSVELLDQLPDRPALYLIEAKASEPLLARTSNLRRRLRRIFRPAVAGSGPARSLNLLTLDCSISYWPVTSQLSASLLLYELSRRIFPDGYAKRLHLPQPAYVKLIRSNLFPRLVVTTALSGGPSLYYGPFRNRASAELFHGQMLGLFTLRRCVEDLEPAPSHPGCIYGEMAMCSRPCQVAVSPHEYGIEVARAAALLETDGASELDPLRHARAEASADMQFEEAARLHKRIERLEQAMSARGDLVAALDRFDGVALAAASVEPPALDVWWMRAGRWIGGDTLVAEEAASEQVWLRSWENSVATTDEGGLPAHPEHLALLVKWHGSSWREGEFLPFQERPPLRRVRRLGLKLLENASASQTTEPAKSE